MTEPQNPSAEPPRAEPVSAPSDPYAPAGAYAPATPRQPTGTVAWAMGFLAYIPIPIIGSIVCSVVMMLVGYAQRAKGEIARRNGLGAANWGLTYLLATVLLVGGAFVTLIVASGGGGRVSDGVSATVFTLLGLWLFPLQIAHLVVTIAGTIKAARGEVFRNPIALPLLR